MAAGSGTVLLGSSACSSFSGKSGRLSDPFRKISLGKTGIKTTFLGMGTGYNGYNRSSSITRAGTAEAVIRYAYDAGIRYFDCADSYGTHPYVAAALRGLPREKYTIGTKIWVAPGGIPETERPDAEVVVDRFRKELNTDYIDLVQIHCMTDGEWTTGQKRYMEGLEKLKAANIIRAHGVSVHSLQALRAASADPWVDIIHVRINPYGENMDERDPELVVPLIRKCHDSGKGLIGMKLAGGGNFRNEPEKLDPSLKFVLGLGIIDMIILGFESPEQIDDYITRMNNISA
jgi:aryl-alcohol dehydrogenase-like predicted oxidoreductase